MESYSCGQGPTWSNSRWLPGGSTRKLRVSFAPPVDETYLSCRDLLTLNLRHQSRHLIRLLFGISVQNYHSGERPPRAAECRSRPYSRHARTPNSIKNINSIKIAGSPAGLNPSADGGASICHRFRSTEAGFWFSARRVPTSPSPTVTIKAASTTPAALEASQTKLSVISRVTIR